MPDPNPNQPDMVVDGNTSIDNIPEGVNQEDPGVKAYMEKMAEKADQGTATNTNTGEELLAGKYKSREDLINGINQLNMKDMSDEDLVKMYKELESGVGSQQSDDDAGSDDDGEDGSNENDDDDSSGDDDSAGDADDNSADDGAGDDSDGSDDSNEDGDTTPKGLTPELIDKFNQEVLENDTLSEESFQTLENMGVTREMVNFMIDGINAQKQALYDVVGSKDKYHEMMAWAGDNLTRGEIEAFNNSLESGDINQMKDQVKLVKMKFGKQNSLPPKTKVKPKGNTTTPVQGYADKKAMTKDMRDPRYKSDPAFRKQVEAKIAKTTWM